MPLAFAMRLMDTRTGHLEEFTLSNVPKYAILSHTWSEKETTYQDVQKRLVFIPPPTTISELNLCTSTTFPNLGEKIVSCCKLALENGHKWIWIDTCCIDKTSSTELSEAINSMFEWYQNAEICIAYLEDVHDTNFFRSPLVTSIGMGPPTRRIGRWFYRGWTLQELIAPSTVLFVTSSWEIIGTKAALASSISSITGIDAALLLLKSSVSDYTILQRMKWASIRETTRIEDMAYSLLGIFGIHMTLIYGEGHAAFRRLQEEIMKASPDQTLFTWRRTSLNCSRFLAPSARCFRESTNIAPIPIDEFAAVIDCLCDAINGTGDDHPRSIKSVSTQGLLYLNILQ